MKYAWSLLCVLSLATASQAQTGLKPKEEYKLLASATSISLTKGKQDSVRLSVIGSRSFKTGKASISANEPKAAGVRAEIKQLPDTG